MSRESIGKKSEVFQLRMDLNELELFKRICEYQKMNMSDQMRILVKDFIQGYIFPTDLYSVKVDVEVGTSKNQPNKAYGELANNLNIKIQSFNIHEDSLHKIVKNPDKVQEVVTRITEEIEKLYFVLPEFFENGQEMYRVDSAYFHRCTDAHRYVSSSRVGRNCLSAVMKKREWSGGLYVYSTQYWPSTKDLLTAPTQECSDNVKKELELSVKKYIDSMISFIVNSVVHSTQEDLNRSKNPQSIL